MAAPAALPQVWTPNPGPQTQFLATRAFECGYGGAAGGGKSEALLVGFLRYVDRPRYRGILFRRTFPELERSLIERSRQLFASWEAAGLARYNATDHLWRFWSGAVLEFGYLERDAHVHKYQSAEFQYVGWDELTTQPNEYPYRYMISRMRSPDGIPLRLRWGSNPGGVGQAWVMRRFAPWLYQPGFYLDEYEGPYAAPGEKLHFVHVDGAEHRVEADDVVECGTCGASWPALEQPPPAGVPDVCDHPVAHDRQFIPSRLEDNPHLMADGVYASKLQQQDPLTHAQLRKGNWLVRPAPGMFFKRRWYRVERELPARTALEAVVRYWDRAATEPTLENPEPDWTVGVLLGRDRLGLLWVLDVVRERAEPHAVEELIVETAAADKKRWGRNVVVGLEQEPGASGKADVKHLSKRLQGYNIEVVRATGKKVDRAKPWSAQTKLGNVRLASAPWNAGYIAEHVGFPGAPFDDQVDASSGAFTVLMSAVSSGRAKTRGKRQHANEPGGF